LDESDDAGVSRRNLLRGATVAGGLVWAAPVVSIGSRAYADGTPSTNPSGRGFSFVALLLTCDRVTYRIKFDFNGTVIKHEWGSSFQVGPCSVSPDSQLSKGSPGVNKADPTAPSTYGGHDAVIQSYGLSPQGDFLVTVRPGATLDDYCVHQGKCCIFKPAKGKTDLNYPVSHKDNTTGTGSHKTVVSTTYTFPAAPNKEPCSLK
jgi:hypothetical protein